MIKIKHILTLLLITVVDCFAFAQDHPSIILTKEGAKEIHVQLGKLPMLDKSFANMKAEVDEQMVKGVQVPIPKDLAGGFSHEQHKRNFFTLQKAGVLFQITGDEKYAQYVRKVLLEYAVLFPKTDRHPATRSYARGKFFWQCLNDANWMVYVSQAYDCIYDWLDQKDRQNLNKNLFRPYADFLSIETPQFFNRIHNHSTWGNAAVGMIGLVLDDEELIKRALYGADVELPEDLVKDNDGGSISLPGQKKAGFLAQIDHAFSPDGYYTEGPYYQRYAMYPFLIFAQALENKKPELKIFEYKKGVLLNAVEALLNQTNAAGEFYPINDAQKGMSYLSRELITAVNIAYHFGHQDPALLSVVQAQGKVPLDDAGLNSAKALLAGKSKPFVKKSIRLSDGAAGNEGALGILRSKLADREFGLLMKYTKHGMGHGHFDKLSIAYYDGPHEIYQDYGAARWVNVEQKDGGGYLKENNSWAKQTIAHNTVVVNQKSQFDGKVKQADLYHSDPYLFGNPQPGVQVMSAKENMAYNGIAQHRTVAMIENESFSNPLILDIFRISSEDKQEHYDLPFYFQGTVLKTNFDIKQPEIVRNLSKDHGYQHLGIEATAQPSTDNAKVNWFYNNRFYTLTTTSDNSDQLLFGRIGMQDPLFNLRRDPVFILRKSNKSDALFVSATEAHGHYSPVTEIATEAYGKVSSLKVLKNDIQYTIVQIDTKDNQRLVFALSNENNRKSTHHSVQLGDELLEWEGPSALITTKIIN